MSQEGKRLSQLPKASHPDWIRPNHRFKRRIHRNTWRVLGFKRPEAAARSASRCHGPSSPAFPASAGNVGAARTHRRRRKSLLRSCCVKNCHIPWQGNASVSRFAGFAHSVTAAAAAVKLQPCASATDCTVAGTCSPSASQFASQPLLLLFLLLLLRSARLTPTPPLPPPLAVQLPSVCLSIPPASSRAKIGATHSNLSSGRKLRLQTHCRPVRDPVR